MYIVLKKPFVSLLHTQIYRKITDPTQLEILFYYLNMSEINILLYLYLIQIHRISLLTLPLFSLVILLFCLKSPLLLCISCSFEELFHSLKLLEISSLHSLKCKRFQIFYFKQGDKINKTY